MANLDPLKLPAESALQVCLLRLTEIVEDENAVLRNNRVVSHAGFTDRKNHALRDVMAVRRVAGLGSAPSLCKPLFTRLSLALQDNAMLLKLHIAAIGEISDIIVNSLREVDSDGTYSRGLRPVRG